jgi:hypothetical protein
MRGIVTTWNKIRSVLDRIKTATVALAILNEGDNKKPFTIFGSGFCVHSKGIVITCEHVLSAFMDRPMHQRIAEIPEPVKNKNERTQIEIRTLIPYAIFYDTKSSAKQIRVFPVRVDIAMAKTNFDIGMVRLHPHAAFKKGFPALEIEDYPRVYEAMEIGTCGFQLGNYLQEQLGTITSSFTRGIVSSIIPSPGVQQEYLEGFQLNLTATHGNSGGPVFTLDAGKVFGVLQRGVVAPDGKLLPGITKAEPVYPVFEHDTLKRMLEAPLGQIPSMD